MRWAERCCMLAALCLAGAALAAPANQATYGKVDTFEPGKKYNCVPSADRKSWDCSQTGKVSERDVPAPHPDEPAPAAPAKPRPPAAAPPSPAATTPRTGTLPSYLLAPGASSPAASSVATAPAPAPAPVAAPKPAAPPTMAEAPKPAPAPAQTPKPAAAPIVHSSTNPSPAPAAAAPPPEPKTAAPPETKTAAPPAAPKPAAPPVEKPAAPAVAAATPAPVRPAAPAPPRAAATSSSSGTFLSLPGEQYVIELAHAERETDIAAARAALHVPRGEVYELHLRQNGGDVWLLVWGSFDDVGAARAARNELPADAHAGWPRRVAPLQAEVRRAGD